YDFNRTGATEQGTIRATAVVIGITESPSDRAFVPKESARHAFVDDPHLLNRRGWTLVTWHPRLGVLWAEVAPRHERDAECGEGVRIDLHPGNDHLFYRLRRIALDRHWVTGLRSLSHHQPFTLAHRTIAHQARQFHAGNGLHPPEQFVEARSELLCFAIASHRFELQHQYVFARKASIHLLQLLQAPHEQAGPDQQEQRQHNLRDDEHFAEG